MLRTSTIWFDLQVYYRWAQKQYELILVVNMNTIIRIVVTSVPLGVFQFSIVMLLFSPSPMRLVRAPWRALKAVNLVIQFMLC